MNYMMWKLKFNFETNFLPFLKSDTRLVMTAVKYLFTIFSGTNVKIIGELYSPSSQFNSFRDGRVIGRRSLCDLPN